MRHSLTSLLLLFLFMFGNLSAANRVVVSTDPIAPIKNNNSSVEIILSWENDILLQGVTNGHIISTTGNVVCEIDSGSALIRSGSRFENGLGWNFRYDDDSNDSLLIGGIYLPGTNEGISVGSLAEAWSFTVSLSFTGGTQESDTGNVCVDTGYVPPAGYWIWDDGTGNINPSFNDGAGAYCFEIIPYICVDSDGDGYGDPGSPANECPDDNCLTVYNPDQLDDDNDGVGDLCDQCPGYDDNLDADGDGVPDDCDQCPGYDDNLDADSDGVADGCDICPQDENDLCCNPIGENDPPVITSDVNDAGYPGELFEYVATADDPDCDGTELVYSFEGYPDWLTVNANAISGIPPCDVLTSDTLNVIVCDGDLCDTILVAITMDNSNQAPTILDTGDEVFVSSGTEYKFSPAIDDPDDTSHDIVFSQIPSWCIISNDSITGTVPDTVLSETVEVTVSDFCNSDDLSFTVSTYICGDANSDATVNVSDAVFIINYVFVGGNAPNPIVAGNVNCDEGVNVSDAVYIINYVFVAGSIPCDCE